MTNNIEEALIEVTAEMQAAWVAYEPPGEFRETMSFARFSRMMRDAFLAGWRAREAQSDTIPLYDMNDLGEKE